MAVDIYLNFNGNCRQTLEFYAYVFGTEQPRIMSYGDAPSDKFPISEDIKNLVIHAELMIKEHKFMFSDVLPNYPFTPGNNISLAIKESSIEGITERFNKLKEGGTVQLDLQETFFSKCYGFVVDKFGIGWQLFLE